MGEPRSVLYCTVLPAAEAFLALGLYWSRPQIAGDPPDDDTPQAELDHFFASMETAVQVRKTPSWPRSWANFSLLYLHSPRNAWTNSRGPTRIFWANVTACSLYRWQYEELRAWRQRPMGAKADDTNDAVPVSRALL